MLKQGRIAIILVMLVALSVFISACGAATDTAATATPTPTPAPAKATCAAGTLQVTGSTALQPIITDIAKEYQTQCKDANITVGGGGSGTGLKNTVDGSSQIGDSDVFADATKYPGLTDHQVAVVVFTIIINSKVTGVKSLKATQLQDIYSGKTTNWKDLGGPDLKIAPVSRSATSGTRLTFEAYVLGTKETVSDTTAASSGEVATTVNQTDGAIAYDTTDFAKKQSLTTINIDGIAPTDANVKSDTYKFWNLEHMYTKGEATGVAKNFIDFVASTGSDQYRKNYSFVNIADMTKAAVAAKTPKA